MIDRVSRIHTRENMTLRRKLTRANKKSLRTLDNNATITAKVRQAEIENSILLGEVLIAMANKF